ncbi:MAG: ATP-grasp domain-containing protein [Planctomycetaceae bacterium]|nr:ATP-grasp domain-containing protein [Planctomycetaceae bacterium]
MRVLLLEYLHAQSDAWMQASASMKAEGRAMLTAVIEDLHGQADVEVTVAACQAAQLDGELCHVLQIADGPEFEFPELLMAAIGRSSFDRVLVIAPETAGILRRVVQRLRHGRQHVVAPSLQAISLCTDKLATCQFLQRHRLPAIASVPLSQFSRLGLTAEQQVVIKQIDGAGSENVTRLTVDQFQASVLSTVQATVASLRSERAIDQACDEPDYLRVPQNYLVQPFVAGRSFSVAAIGRGEHLAPLLLPVCEQSVVWHNDACRYDGGVVQPELAEPLIEQLQTLTFRICQAINLRQGYLGVDFVIDESSPDPAQNVYIAEVNPRLCTSYAGYRQLAGDNLARALLQIDQIERLSFRSGQHTFAVTPSAE